MKLFFFIFCVSFTNLIYCQSYYEIDLSNSNFDENTISNKTSGVKLINKLINKDYKVTIKVENELNIDNAGHTADLVEDECKKKYAGIFGEIAKIESATSEIGIASSKKTLNDSSKKIDKKDPCKQAIDLAIQEVLAKTEKSINFSGFTLSDNQNIHIKIERLGDDDNVEKTWDLIVRTPRTANYISHFGFTFSPGWIKTPDQYFSKLTGKNMSNTDSFTITKLNSNGMDFWKDLSLTANFLIPFDRKKKVSENNNLSLAWLAGVGVGGDARFTVFTGPALLFKDFTAIGLVFGVNYSHKLKGEYEPRQGLKEQLSFDQLHVRGIRPDIMLTLSFRLSKKQLQGDIENIGGK